MTALVVVVIAAVLVLVATLLVLRRRAIAREASRVAMLRALADQLGAVIGSLQAEHPGTTPITASAQGAEGIPTTTQEPPGRAGLLRAVAEAINAVEHDRSRLSVALVESATLDAGSLAERAGALAATRAYTVGPRSAAIVLTGYGRAEALGILARIEADCGATGRAVELARGEGAVELIARLLSPGALAEGTPPEVSD